MAELLTTEEIRAFYDKLLTKPDYIKTLKKSLNSEAKMEQVLDYARRVNREALHQIEFNIEQSSLMNLYLKKTIGFEFPPYPNEQMKNFDYSDFSYKEKLNYWLVTSETIIRLFDEKKPGISNPELALIKFYQGEVLIDDRSDLYNKWVKYSKKANRLGAESTDQKNKNKIELFEKVIEKLSGDHKIHAEKDLKALKDNIDNQDFIK